MPTCFGGFVCLREVGRKEESDARETRDALRHYGGRVGFHPVVYLSEAAVCDIPETFSYSSGVAFEDFRGQCWVHLTSLVPFTQDSTPHPKS